jgi:hypothetical protein
MGVTIFEFLTRYMGGILLANREQRCAERFLTCLQNGYGGLSLTIRVQVVIKVAHTRFRAVGHRKGGKQLLNTSAGLVRTVVQNELTMHGVW